MNYEKKVMESTYEILMKKDFTWSYEFKDEMKVQLVTLLIDYFTDIEEYEKCAHLSKLLTNLGENNENMGEAIATGSNNH